MKAQLFDIQNYFTEPECFHLARKHLASDQLSQLHCHNYFEFFIVELGSASHLINGVKETLEKGDLFFIRPHDEHAFQADPVKGCRILNLMIRIESIDHLACRYGRELKGRWFWSDERQPARYRLTGSTFDWVIENCWALNKKRQSLSQVEVFVLTLASRLAKSSTDAYGGAPGWLLDACERARDPQYLKAGSLGLIEAARRSHEHVCRNMRQYKGETPSQFMNRLRVEHAALMLEQTELTLEEIAEECGWNSVSYFYRLFKAQTGTTPKAYRQCRGPSPF